MTTMPQGTRRKTKVGRVVSDRMDKTIVVAVERLARHAVYKRVVRVTSKFKAHDEGNTAHVGDRVLIEESRPLSREKRWRLVEVLTQAGQPVEVVAEEPETTAAIGMAAHPGRRAKEEAAESEAPPDDAADAGVSAAASEAVGAQRPSRGAAEGAAAEKPTSGKSKR
jgi:small subunit ribosomal protein S17